MILIMLLMFIFSFLGLGTFCFLCVLAFSTSIPLYSSTPNFLESLSLIIALPLLNHSRLFTFPGNSIKIAKIALDSPQQLISFL